MTAPLVGEKVRVSYADKSGSPYVLHVEVLEITASDQFIGRIESIFAKGIGEVTGGDILALKGQKATFGVGDLIAGI
jgi:hypothetical protein